MDKFTFISARGVFERERLRMKEDRQWEELTIEEQNTYEKIAEQESQFTRKERK